MILPIKFAAGFLGNALTQTARLSANLVFCLVAALFSIALLLLASLQFIGGGTKQGKETARQSWACAKNSFKSGSFALLQADHPAHQGGPGLLGDHLPQRRLRPQGRPQERPPEGPRTQLMGSARKKERTRNQATETTASDRTEGTDHADREDQEGTDCSDRSEDQEGTTREDQEGNPEKIHEGVGIARSRIPGCPDRNGDGRRQGGDGGRPPRRIPPRPRSRQELREKKTLRLRPQTSCPARRLDRAWTSEDTSSAATKPRAR